MPFTFSLSSFKSKSGSIIDRKEFQHECIRVKGEFLFNEITPISFWNYFSCKFSTVFMASFFLERGGERN